MTAHNYAPTKTCSEGADMLGGSPQLGSAAQAPHHRYAQQIGARERRVGRGAPHLVAKPRPVGLVARLEVALVLDRLGLDVFERDQAALAVVTVEFAVRRLVLPHRRQTVRQ